MYITPVLAVFALLQISSALPQLVPFQDDPSTTLAKCQGMEAAMNACFKDTPYLLNDLELDEAAMRKCVCSKESFTAEIVTLCTGDPKTYSDLCSDVDVAVDPKV